MMTWGVRICCGLPATMERVDEALREKLAEVTPPPSILDLKRHQNPAPWTMHAIALARRRIDPSRRECGRRSVSSGGGVSGFARARAGAWRAARGCSASSRMTTMMTISPHEPILVTSQPPPVRPRYKPPFTNAPLISAGDGSRAGLGGARVSSHHPPSPSPPGRPAPLLISSRRLVGWFCDDGRRTPSCLAARVARWGDR